MNKNMRVGCGIAVAIFLGLCVLVQLPVLLFQSNPPVVQEPKWDSPQTRALAKRACFDCHSNETNWTWYTRVPPSSLLATFDVIRGRRNLNFSEWNVAPRGGESEEGEGGEGGEGGGEAGELIQNGEMPPGNYLMMHPEARLTNQEKLQLIAGLQNSLR